MKLFETLKDQDFMKQNSEIQRNGGFRLTLLVGLTLVHWANKIGKPFNLIGCAMKISNRDTYVYSVRPNQLEQMLLRKLMKSTDQRQIIYNYLCSQLMVKIQKVSETFGTETSKQFLRLFIWRNQDQGSKVFVSYDWRIWWVVSYKSVSYRKGMRVRSWSK